MLQQLIYGKDDFITNIINEFFGKDFVGNCQITWYANLTKTQLQLDEKMNSDLL